MRNIFIGILIFLVASIFFLFAMDGNRFSDSQERYDAYVNYENLDVCTQYIDFMECVVDRIDDTVSRRIYKNNIYLTVRNRASYKDSDDLKEICTTSLIGLGEEKALHKYGCKINSEDSDIQNLVLPEDLKIKPVDVADLTTGDVAQVPPSSGSITIITGANLENLTGAIEIETGNLAPATGIVEIITSNNGTGILSNTGVIYNPVVPYTRIQVIQNRVGFLRIRQRPSTASLELGRLGIWDVVDVIGQEGRRYNIKYGENGEYSGRVSAKYVVNIGLEVNSSDKQ